MAKRLVRARRKIRVSRVQLEIPAGPALNDRLDTVLQALYLLFNEGYKTSQGEELVRHELCEEAIRLATLLIEHSAGDQPKTHALLALMLLNAARLNSRADSAGNMLLLSAACAVLSTPTLAASPAADLARQRAMAARVQIVRDDWGIIAPPARTKRLTGDEFLRCMIY